MYTDFITIVFTENAAVAAGIEFAESRVCDNQNNERYSKMLCRDEKFCFGLVIVKDPFHYLQSSIVKIYL